MKFHTGPRHQQRGGIVASLLEYMHLREGQHLLVRAHSTAAVCPVRGARAVLFHPCPRDPCPSNGLRHARDGPRVHPAQRNTPRPFCTVLLMLCIGLLYEKLRAYSFVSVGNFCIWGRSFHFIMLFSSSTPWTGPIPPHCTRDTVRIVILQIIIETLSLVLLVL